MYRITDGTVAVDEFHSDEIDPLREVWREDWTSDFSNFVSVQID
jgi:hypothetical protein